MGKQMIKDKKKKIDGSERQCNSIGSMEYDLIWRKGLAFGNIGFRHTEREWCVTNTRTRIEE